jgi:hypothetical protein
MNIHPTRRNKRTKPINSKNIKSDKNTITGWRAYV